MNSSHKTDQAQQAWQATSPRDCGLVYSKGIAMGLGDSVPGVSGGTIAVITGIYETLIHSICRVDLVLLRLVLSGQWRQGWRHCNGTFLLLLLIGILSGLLLSARTVLFLLDNYFAPLMSFFIGLVLASTWLLRTELNWRHPGNLIAVLLGILLTSGVGLLEAGSGEPSLIYLLFCGAVAISAMILPGLSGAFILLLLGAYETMLQALLGLELLRIAVFFSGCIFGLLAFSRLLDWLLSNWHQRSYGFICGLLLGSLSVLWPWQQPLSFYTDSDGVQQVLRSQNVSPLDYEQLSGQPPLLLISLVAVAAGIALVLGLHRSFRNSDQAGSARGKV